MKQGYLTTKFGMSVAGMLASILVLAGVLTPEQSSEVLVMVAAIFAGLIPIVYTVMRTLAKWNA